MLAGVGTTWYTWLEQGRDVRPSDELLSALSEALRLDPTERRHLLLCMTGGRRSGRLRVRSGSMSRFAGCWTA